jgi:hypothetical protein
MHRKLTLQVIARLFFGFRLGGAFVVSALNCLGSRTKQAQPQTFFNKSMTKKAMGWNPKRRQKGNCLDELFVQRSACCGFDPGIK